MHAPWRFIPKNKHHECLDILALIPHLLWLCSKLRDMKMGPVIGPISSRRVRQPGVVHHQVIRSVSSSLRLSSNSKPNLQLLTASQNFLASELLVYDAVHRIGQLTATQDFRSYASQAESMRPKMTMVADSIIETLQDFNIGNYGLLGMHLIFLPARTAIRHLLREQLD